MYVYNFALQQKATDIGKKTMHNFALHFAIHSSITTQKTFKTIRIQSFIYQSNKFIFTISIEALPLETLKCIPIESYWSYNYIETAYKNKIHECR